MSIQSMVEPVESSGRWRALALLALAELLCMALWFSASAVVPALTVEWNLEPSQAGWLTLAVQLGFVAGTLLSALLNLPDIISARRLIAICAFLGATVNVLFGVLAADIVTGVLLRFLVGLFLAGVYPPGMKVMATWFRRGRGMALGVLIGALTFGKASPYLVNAIGSADWRMNIVFVSLFAIVGGLIILLFVGDGPYTTPAVRFDVRQAALVFKNRGVRLANFGYFGHMWELYAMWTWLPVMIRTRVQAHGESLTLAEAASFLIIGAGAVGCVIAGLVADRIGRTIVTSVAMIISGACCIFVGFAFGLGSTTLLLVVAGVWGATVVADSAQFSACVTELADRRYIGTALTIQTCCGFLITAISIQLIPMLVDRVGWNYAFVVLAFGPLLGTISMLRLRSLPESVNIAQGRR